MAARQACRREICCSLLFFALLAPRPSHAQSLDAGVASTPPASNPVLEPPSATELDALRPLIARGMAVIVRDADQGGRARITVLTRAQAPIGVVHSVIVAPESYTTFMPTLTSVEVISRHGPRVAFRFHVSAVIFDVAILSALQAVGSRRVDVSIVQSDIGPGGSRWDLFPDGEGTLVALSTWGDPSRGNWFLRQIAARAPNAIAGMNISADTILTLGVARRAEILAGRNVPVRPPVRSVPSGPLEPPPPGAWSLLARDAVVASTTLDTQGALQQTSVAMWSPLAPDAIVARLLDVSHYPDHWHSIESVQVLASQGNTMRYRTSVRSTFTTTQGEEERTLERRAGGATIRLRGVAGDYVGNDHRWDVDAAPGGGSIVTFTGASEYARASFLSRSVMERDVWLTPGYATSFLMVWMRPVLTPP